MKNEHASKLGKLSAKKRFKGKTKKQKSEIMAQLRAKAAAKKLST